MGFGTFLQRKLYSRKRDLKELTKVAGGSLLVMVGVFFGGILFSDRHPLFENMFHGVTNYGTNLWTEAISVTLTIFVLNILSERRERRRREEDLKARLLREARSTVNIVASQAINEMREYDWLTGECRILSGANLSNANLEKASLWEAQLGGSFLDFANLRKANLLRANLYDAKLRNAKLQEAQMILVNLQNANLHTANLTDANLYGADLQNAKLELADLCGANLEETNLVGADLRFATFDNRTILPDGKRWYIQMDMGRYTNPKHPQFWRSIAPQSPAYKARRGELVTV